MSENNWNHFKIVPQGHHNCQLSIVNCQFGEAVKFQFFVSLRNGGNCNFNLREAAPYLISRISYLISQHPSASPKPFPWKKARISPFSAFALPC